MVLSSIAGAERDEQNLLVTIVRVAYLRNCLATAIIQDEIDDKVVKHGYIL